MGDPDELEAVGGMSTDAVDGGACEHEVDRSWVGGSTVARETLLYYSISEYQVYYFTSKYCTINTCSGVLYSTENCSFLNGGLYEPHAYSTCCCADPVAIA